MHRTALEKGVVIPSSGFSIGHVALSVWHSFLDVFHSLHAIELQYAQETLHMYGLTV